MLEIKNRYHGNVREKHNRVGSNSDSGVSYLVAPSSFSDAQLLNLWADLGGDIYSYRCSHEHDCCGCVLYSKPYVVRVNSRAIVYQSFSRNV